MADHQDDLEELLDSALSDFQSLNLTPSTQRNGREDDGGKDEGYPSTSLPTTVQGLGMGMGLPDLKSKNKNKKNTGNNKGKQKLTSDAHVAEALDKLRQETREAVRGLESVMGANSGNLDKDDMMEDWIKQFEKFAGSQDMESVVETMMQQLLSKEILHEPMKEIGERYPKWLEEHKGSLSKDECERYAHQYELIKNLNEVYENEPNNFNKIVDLMQKMQECGQPPSDIVQELAPDFDLANLGQISPEMLESQPNCCIM